MTTRFAASRRLRFGHGNSVELAHGGEAVSDPVRLRFRAFAMRVGPMWPG
jgi:hypothetical protein